MRSTTNVPYVKKYNKNGVCTNPVKDAYISYDENRRERRAERNEPRFEGNSAGPHLTVIKDMKYKRVIQWIKINLAKGKTLPFSQKTFRLKPIKHYLPSNVNSVKAVNQVAVKP